MLTRRRFGIAAAAGAATLAAPAVGRAQQLVKMRVGLASGVNDAQVAFQSIGMHPKLNWYKEEGVELEIVNSSSTMTPLQLLTTGQIEFATIAPGTLLPPYAANANLGITCAYMWMPRVHTHVVVKPDSAITEIKHLKGKKIGIRGPGDSGYFFLQAVFKQMGIDPQKDVEWVSINAGGPAGQALYNGTVEAISIWDVEYTRIEIAGFKLRPLANPPGASDLFGNSYAVPVAAFEKSKARYAGLFRAIAKGQLFTANNPRAAVQLHWDLYPESKPKGKSEQEAMDDMLKILATRRDKWFQPESSPDRRMGAARREQWEASVKFIGLINPKVAEIKDVSKLYTNEVIDDANKFDRKAFVEAAKGFKV
jgi:NitT/TauT family transport system substrate-binding protein